MGAAQRRGEEWIPEATEGDRAFRLGVHFGVGFAGQARLQGGGFSGNADLEPTITLGIRAELPVWRYLAIGGQFQFNSFNVTDGDDQRDAGLDFDVWVKGRYPLDVGELKVIPYLGLPFGASVLILEDSDNLRGFNLGALAGVELVFEHFAPYFEIGWRVHRVGRSESGVDLRLLSNQVRMNFGVAYRF